MNTIPQRTRLHSRYDDTSSTHPVLCPDGKYRWVYDVPMLKNPSILNEVFRVLGISFGVVWMFVLLLGVCSDGFDLQSIWSITRGFLLLMAFQRDLGALKRAVHDRTGMRYALIMTVFGPVLGVSLSLMAVQYTGAGIASTLMALTPVFILFPYAFIYRQRIKIREVIGVAVSMLGVALFFLL